MKKYARRCDATGRGINAGYVIDEGRLYFADKCDLLVHLKSTNWVDADGNRSFDIKDDNELLDFFYREEYYYYTEWDEDDFDGTYYDEEGNKYEC